MENPNPYQTPETVSTTPEAVTTSGQQDGPAGLGGWLILVGLGTVLSPFRLGALIVQTYLPLFSDGTWEALTTPGSEQYQVLWAPLLIFELVGNAGFLLAYLVLALLFFRKSRFFPRVYIALSLLNLCFIVVDAWFASYVLTEEPMFDPDTARELTRSVVAICIWVPYMLVSKRVKNTFVR